MKPIDALRVLDMASGKAPLDRQSHKLCEEALLVLAKALDIPVQELPKPDSNQDQD